MKTVECEQQRSMLWLLLPWSVVGFCVRRAAQPMMKPSLDNDNTNNDNRIERRKLKLLQSPHCGAKCLQHVRSSGPGTIVCKSRATHRELTCITCNTSRTYMCHVQHIENLMYHVQHIENLMYHVQHVVCHVV